MRSVGHVAHCIAAVGHELVWKIRLYDGAASIVHPMQCARSTGEGHLSRQFARGGHAAREEEGCRERGKVGKRRRREEKGEEDAFFDLRAPTGAWRPNARGRCHLPCQRIFSGCRGRDAETVARGRKAKGRMLRQRGKGTAREGEGRGRLEERTGMRSMPFLHFPNNDHS